MEVTEGCRLPVRMRSHSGSESVNNWQKAEVLSIRQLKNGVKEYYVHFVDFKNLDEWVTEDRLNFRRIKPPSLKDDKTTESLLELPEKNVSDDSNEEIWVCELKSKQKNVVFLWFLPNVWHIFDDFLKWSMPKLLQSFEKSSKMHNNWAKNAEKPS